MTTPPHPAARVIAQGCALARAIEGIAEIGPAGSISGCWPGCC